MTAKRETAGRRTKPTGSNTKDSNKSEKYSASGEGNPLRDTTRAFLRRLDPEAKRFSFQTFDDKGENRKLARVLQGDPANGALDELAQLNADGAGIFVTVNETDLKGRQTHNIKRVRAVFVDLDGAPLEPILNAPLKPHIVVQSSPGKYHAYWLCGDCSREQFEMVQRALARRFAGDPSVHDLPRVLRVPGFLHQKFEPFQTQLLNDGFDGPPYPLARIVESLQLQLADERVERAHAGKPGDDGKIREPGRNEHLFKLGRSMVAKGATQATVFAALSEENRTRCAPPLSDERVRYIAERVFTAKDAADYHAPNSDAARDDDDRWPVLNLAELAKTDPKPPTFIMPGMPCGYATATFGHGGMGKSGIELTRAVCIASGKLFWGLPVERRHVMYLSCEDRKPVLHWRLTRICDYLDIDLADLSGWLEVIDLVGINATLVAPDSRTGSAGLTSAFGALERLMQEFGTEVLFVDGISDTFGGNENARGDPKRYVNTLLSLVPESGALVLIGHVDKAIARSREATTEGYSGSTAWNNTVRSRWYLHRESETNKLVLELQKSNHGEIGTQIEFEWNPVAELFVGRTRAAGAPSQFATQQRDQEERAGILLALQACVENGITVPIAASGQRTALRVLRARPEFPESIQDDAKGRKRFWHHIEALRQTKAITVGTSRRANGHGTECFFPSGGGPECVK